MSRAAFCVKWHCCITVAIQAPQAEGAEGAEGAVNHHCCGTGDLGNGLNGLGGNGERGRREGAEGAEGQRDESLLMGEGLRASRIGHPPIALSPRLCYNIYTINPAKYNSESKG